MKNTKKKKKNNRNRSHPQAQPGSWSSLPAEMESTIFNLLPLHAIDNAKSVCKRWRSMLSNKSEPQNADIQGDTLLPLLCPSRGGYPWFAFHPASGKWRRLPTPAFIDFSILQVHSSHKGLLLVEECESYWSNGLHICNWSTGKSESLREIYIRHGRQRLYAPSVYWYHLHVDPDRESYTIWAMLKLTRSCLFRVPHIPHWPTLIRFDSGRGTWILVKPDKNRCEYLPPAFFEDCDNFVVIDDSIYMVATSKFNTMSYLVQFDSSLSCWRLISTLPFPGATIVSYYSTFFVVALDARLPRFLLYRFRHGGSAQAIQENRSVNEEGYSHRLSVNKIHVNEEGCSHCLNVDNAHANGEGCSHCINVDEEYTNEEGFPHHLNVDKAYAECFTSHELILVGSSGPKLADFVSDCVGQRWFASASPRPPSCIYIGRQREARSIVAFNVLLKSWKVLPLPDFLTDHSDGNKPAANCVCAQGYEVGLMTPISWNLPSDDDSDSDSSDNDSNSESG